MATSQNGYPVLTTNRTTGTLPRLRKWQIAGTGRYVYLRDGSAGFLLAHLAHWFHNNIEKIDTGTWDDWGWAVRPIRGQSTGYSNHAAGCAIDINATRHPRGVAITKTFTKTQVDKIHAQLKVYGGVIGWGGDYTKSPKDGMHFEIVKPLADAERVARVLWTSPDGAPIIAANKGAADVIWDGQVPPVVVPPVVPPVQPKGTHLFIDCSYTVPDPAAIKAAGFVGVGRYLPIGKGKDLTAAEAQAHLAAGLWLFGIWELTANRALGGKAAGAADVAAAEAAADSVGYPREDVIFYTVDFDATPAQVTAYFRAIKAAAVRPVGVYGSDKVVDALLAAGLADWGWQSTAWSGGRVSSKAHLFQRVTHSKAIAGVSTNAWDEDAVLRGTVPVWNPGEPAYVPPVVPPPVIPPVIPDPLVISVSSSNIKSNPPMSLAHVTSDIAHVAGIPTTGARVWFGQEIVAGRYAKAWATGLPGTTYCGDEECPITLDPADWTIGQATVEKMHNGLIHVTPARYLSTVTATSTARPDVKVAFIDTHFISGAWSNNYPKTKAWRRARWSSHWAQLQDAVTRLVDAGYTVVVGADTNRETMPALHVGQLVPVEHGIDHLWVIPAAGRTVKVTGKTITAAGALFTDHDAIGATLSIT